MTTTLGLPGKNLAKNGASKRAEASVLPPGLEPTIKVTVLPLKDVMSAAVASVGNVDDTAIAVNRATLRILAERIDDAIFSLPVRLIEPDFMVGLLQFEMTIDYQKVQGCSTPVQ